MNQRKQKPKVFRSVSTLSSHLLALSSSDSDFVFTFDVFDTLVHRRVHSDAVVDGVCQWLDRVFDDAGISKEMCAKDARNLSYREAIYERAKRGLDLDVSLEAFVSDWVSRMAELPEELHSKLCGQILEREATSELAVTYPNNALLDTLKILKFRGHKTIYISDMYLGKKIVDEILDKSGYRGLFDAGYVSGDHSLLKRTGNLYHHVEKCEDIPAGKWVHAGDNMEADGHMAAAVGIQSLVIRDRLIQSDIKKKTFDQKMTGSFQNLWGLRVADFLSSYDSPSVSLNAYGKYALGPIFSNFVHAIIERSITLGIKDVYFFAREGKLLLEVFDIIQSNSSDLRVRELRGSYLGVSRLSTIKPAAVPFTQRDFTSFALNASTQTLEAIFLPLGISREVLSRVAARYGIFNIADQIKPNFVASLQFQNLLDDVELQSSIQLKSANSKELLLEYLLQEGIGESSKVAFVDLGWGGQIQENIRRTLRQANVKTKIFGMYLGANHWSIEREVEDSRYMPLLASPSNFHWSSRSAFEMVQGLETLVRAHHGSVIGYKREENHVVPIFKSVRDMSRKLETRDETLLADIHQGIRSYASGYACAIELFSLSSVSTLRYAESLLERLVRYPTPDEANMILGFTNAADLGSSESRSIGGSAGGRKSQLLESLWIHGTFAKLYPRWYQPYFVGLYGKYSLPHKSQVTPVTYFSENYAVPNVVSNQGSSYVMVKRKLRASIEASQTSLNWRDNFLIEGEALPTFFTGKDLLRQTAGYFLARTVSSALKKHKPVQDGMPLSLMLRRSWASK